MTKTVEVGNKWDGLSDFELEIIWCGLRCYIRFEEVYLFIEIEREMDRRKMTDD